MMLPTYTATLRDGVLDWGDIPPTLPTGDVAVHVTLLPASPAARSKQGKGGAAMAEALEALVAANVGLVFGDPVEWQCEVREDRPLLGREE